MTNYIYGLMPVLEALRARRRAIREIVLAEGNRPTRLEQLLQLAQQANIPVRYHKRPQLDRLANGANHQGVIALAAAVEYGDFEQVLANINATTLLVLLDGVEDPHNLGAIIRTAECAGAQAVIIPEHHAVGLTETVLKTAAGAAEYLPLARVTNLVQTIDALKAASVWVVGIEATGKINYTAWDYQGPTAIVLGSEGKGLRRLVREHCDTLAAIPLFGKVSSLNVSVATGIVLYEAARQRQLHMLNKLPEASHE
jgi:23S rRNA (guanosine2251-2'-O)-methyltransferase